jgi:hypothetical protein
MSRHRSLFPPILQSIIYQFFLMVVLILFSARLHQAHNNGAPAAPCAYDQGLTVEGEYRPGLITLDADSKDWADVEGFKFPLMQAINFVPSEKYPMDPGSIQIKVRMCLVYFELTEIGSFYSL